MYVDEIALLGISNIFTARKRSLGQGNIFRSVCQEFCSQRGEYLGKYTPRQVHPPWQVHPLGRYTPLGQVHSPGRYTPLAGTRPGQVHPPGPGTPPRQVHPQAGTPPWQVYPLGRYTPQARYISPSDGQCAGGMHPTGMHSCLYIKLKASCK